MNNLPYHLINRKPIYVKFDLVEEWHKKFNMFDFMTVNHMDLQSATLKYYYNMINTYRRFILCTEGDGIFDTKFMVNNDIGQAIISNIVKNTAIIFELYPEYLSISHMRDPICSGTWAMYPEGLELMNLVIVEGENKK